MVAPQPAQMEWEIYFADDTAASDVGRRKRPRLWWQVPRQHHPRSVDHGGARAIHQLARAQGHSFDDPIISPVDRHHDSGMNGQHYSEGIHQPSGRHQVSYTELLGDHDLGGVLTTATSHPSSTHCQHRQRLCESSISPLLCQEPLADTSVHVHAASSSVGPSRCGSVCRSHQLPTSPVCVVEARSSSIGNGYVQHILDHVSESLHTPTLESYPPGSTKNPT